MHLLVTGAWQGAKENIGRLEAAGHSVDFLQYEKDELPCPYDKVEGVVCNGLFLYHDIEKFSSLRYIQLTSQGYDRVPMGYVKDHGIVINNARGVYSIPMAELAICGVLQLYKQSRFFSKNQEAHQWIKHRGLLELAGKTVCIVGCGSVGGECAKRFSAFGCRVLGVDLYPKETRYFEGVYPLDNLDNALGSCDILVLTLPLTEETRHLIDASRIAKLKDGAVIVNIARGAVVDTEALISALPRLGGGVLDVFEEEPLSESSPLWDSENVIITPHNSFVGEGCNRRLSEVILENLANGQSVY